MTATVARTLRRRALGGPSDRVAVAISGGADSVGLAIALQDLEGNGGPTVVGLIHVNHGLRGPDSDADESFCRALAGRFAWPIEVGRVDVRRRARERHCSIEVAAREARYAFFPTAARALAATQVATAHTLDDQAETVLLRLLRGAGLRGLSGIPPRRGIYVRPLIDVRRADVRAFLTARGESWREDASNADVSIARNRLRHEVIPHLGRLAPGGLVAVARFADLAADDEAALEALAIEMVPALVLSKEVAAFRIDAAALARTPPALARRVVRRVVAMLDPDVAFGADHIEAVRALARTDTPNSAADLPGIRATRDAGGLRIARTPAADGDRAAPFCRTLEIPGTVSIPEAGVVITALAQEASDAPDRRPRAEGLFAVLSRAAVTPPLIVRNWRPGDRMRPLGAPGRRKLQDLFVDRKIPRGDRGRIPVIEDAAGRILWVAGVAVAEAGRVSTPEASVVILEMRKDQ